MENQDDSFEVEPCDNTGFFDDIGGGMLLSKKEAALRKTILQNSEHIHQKTLDEKVQKYQKQKNIDALNKQPIPHSLPDKSQKPTKQNNTNKLTAINNNTEEQIKVKASTSKVPKKSFEDLKLIKPLLKAVSELEYSYPTPIQVLTIPAILSGKDVFASSITGSGKTAAFLLPILQRFYNCEAVNYSRVLIMTPTRELAIQCYENFTNLNKYTRLEACLCIGASSIQKQETQLRNYPEIIIGTPGRILDLLTNSQSFGLENLQVMIFDEADKLLEMGFEAEIKQIITYLSENVQTILFSATLGSEVNKLASLAMRKPIRLSADPDNTTAERLHQQILKLPSPCSDEYREAALISVITKVYTEKVIIFFKTKKECHRMAIIAGLLGLKACELHGNLSQTQRIQAFHDFKEGKYDFLMATDLASRGLDIKEVKSVINYELPTQLTRYIHRVGRTARAGCIGTSLTLCDDSECLKIKKMMRKTNDKLFKLSLDASVVKENIKLIESLERDINRINDEEREERALRVAEMELKKLQNINNHQDEIYNKPKKTWFLSNKEKNDIKRLSKKEALGEDYVEEEPRRRPVNKNFDNGKGKNNVARTQKIQKKGGNSKGGFKPGSRDAKGNKLRHKDRKGAKKQR